MEIDDYDDKTIIIHLIMGEPFFLIFQHTIFLCLMNCIKSYMLHFYTTPKSYGFFAFFSDL